MVTVSLSSIIAQGYSLTDKEYNSPHTRRLLHSLTARHVPQQYQPKDSLYSFTTCSLEMALRSRTAFNKPSNSSMNLSN